MLQLCIRAEEDIFFGAHHVLECSPVLSNTCLNQSVDKLLTTALLKGATSTKAEPQTLNIPYRREKNLMFNCLEICAYPMWYLEQDSLLSLFNVALFPWVAMETVFFFLSVFPTQKYASTGAHQWRRLVKCTCYKKTLKFTSWDTITCLSLITIWHPKNPKINIVYIFRYIASRSSTCATAPILRKKKFILWNKKGT